MKHLLVILVLIICTNVNGQQVVGSQHQYRKDDVLEIRQIKLEGKDLRRERDVWSIEGTKVSKRDFRAAYSAVADRLMKTERGNRTYYRQDRDIVSIIGSESAQTFFSYDIPETWLKFPMQVGDSVFGYFNGTGKYCDRLFIRRFGNYLTKADAVGEIVLPSGNTLHNVLRLHTERHISTIATPIDTMKFKIPAFTVDSIIRRMAADTMQIQEDVYRWYAEGYRYPVLEATVVSRGEQIFSDEVFFSPPELQEQLVLDEANMRVRERMTATARELDESKGESGDNGFTFRISRDDGNETITVNYSSKQPVRVTILLANSQGYVYRRASQTNGSPISLSYSGLRQGQYILKINTDSEHFSEKFNVK